MTGERLLIVDDSAELRDALVDTLLGPEGFEVVLAESGAQGLAHALADKPDLIITNQVMPDMTGLEMLRAIADAGQRIPAILITEEGSEDIAIQALRLGMVDYFKKPLKPAELMAAIARGLEQTSPGTLSSPGAQPNVLTSLLDVGQVITASLDLETTLSQVVEEAVRLCGAEESVLMLLDLESEELYTRASMSADEDTVRSLRLPVHDSLAGQVINTGQSLLVDEGEHKIRTEYLVKSLLYVPLLLMGQVIGVLGVSNRVAERSFSQEDVEVLSVLANYAAIAIANARAFEESSAERARFRTMLERSSDAVLVVNELGYIILINRGACEALSVEPLDVLGYTMNEAIGNPDLRRLFERHGDRLDTRGEVSLPDGRTFNAQLTAIEGLGCVAVMQDVTPLKELDRMKTRFVSMVSHDLRSPLTAILGYVELMGRVGEVTEQQADFIKRVKTSVHAMTNLINDLLDLGRIETGMDRAKEEVGLGSLLTQVCESLQPRCQAKGQQFKFACPDDLPLVLGNPLRLRQAISNLIDNAIKYTPEGGSISLAAHTTGEHVIVQVRDTGLGIPPADQPHVFDEFYRAEAVSQSHEGTGLGLAIVKSVVEAHEGRIWLESKPDEGSTFTIALPAYIPGEGLSDSPHAP